MLTAVLNGERVEARRGLTALCPLCGDDVIPKCGRIVTHHWAHKSVIECDPWAEGESQWHIDWKRQFPSSWREVVVGPHRADVRRPDGYVIELQHSSISPDEIEGREQFYGPMSWVFDARQAVQDGRLYVSKRQPEHVTFRWKHGRTTIRHCRRPVYIDWTDGSVLQLGRLWTDGGCRGWGRLMTRQEAIGLLLTPRWEQATLTMEASA
jgi:competence protein CoiA